MKTEIKLKKYKKINEDCMRKVKDILLNANFKDKNIELHIPKIDMNIKIDDITMPETVNKFICVSSFLWGEDYYVVEHGDNKFKLSIEIWDKVTLKNEYSVNISLDCDCNDFGVGFGRGFYQIELSEALEDNENVYLVRNITQLYNNSTSSEIEEFGCDILLQSNERYLVISKINKKYLNDVSKHNEILFNFLVNFIRCAFVNEAFKLEILL